MAEALELSPDMKGRSTKGSIFFEVSDIYLCLMNSYGLTALKTAAARINVYADNTTGACD
ncbi:hypothetical protein N7456_000077 [Penicillium angulare]|uniref:Uncharacterized protein n=1 Tax=Penicillium angulare TaxID=116970 RepID=A0A9W9KRW6_9EURO|nr:hypothetical protein N7456_000077 [Penicillium angulare]